MSQNSNLLATTTTTTKATINKSVNTTGKQRKMQPYPSMHQCMMGTPVSES